MKYDIEKRRFLLKKYHEKKNIAMVQRAYRTKYVTGKAPSVHMIQNLIDKFDKLDIIENAPRFRQESDQKRKEAVNPIKKAIEENPQLSIKKTMQVAQTSYTTTRKILKEDLGLIPYKNRERQRLLPLDKIKRVEFARWFLSLPQYSCQYMICTDEAWFTLTPSLNIQNNRVWSDESPSAIHEKPLHDQKIMAFSAISSKKIYGIWFFESNVNGANYLEMLQNWFWRKHVNTVDYKKFIFQQDGARPHTTKAVQTWLHDKFGTKFISKEKWPPRSPDLNPCDFFLWGYLKERVYSPIPKNIEELKANIEREASKIPTKMLENTFFSFRNRLEKIILNNGEHFE